MSGIVDYGSITDEVNDGVYSTGDIPSRTDRVFRDIRLCFEARLSGLSTDFSNIIYENTQFDLSTLDKDENGVSWIRGALLPAETVSAAIGTSGSDLHSGLFRIDYFNEVGVGGYEVDMDIIANAFVKGDTLIAGTTEVRIKNVSLGVGRRDGAFFARNIDIEYFAYTAART